MWSPIPIYGHHFNVCGKYPEIFFEFSRAVAVPERERDRVKFTEKLAEQWRIRNSERQRRTHYRFVICREWPGPCGSNVWQDSFGSSMCSNASFLPHDGVYGPDL
jgi:hypothetical protein